MYRFGCRRRLTKHCNCMVGSSHMKQSTAWSTLTWLCQVRRNVHPYEHYIVPSLLPMLCNISLCSLCNTKVTVCLQASSPVPSNKWISMIFGIGRAKSCGKNFI
jgi:hypothetical protein